MKLDIPTLALISCVTFLTQLIALFVQYTVNRSDRGIRWWLLGSAFWALGMILIPMVITPTFAMLALLGNPLVILGQIFLYVGMVRFLAQKENRAALIFIFCAFVFVYYYFFFVDNSLFGRTIGITVVSALISWMMALKIFRNKGRLISGSANFTALAFLVYGSFSAIRLVVVLISPPIQTYSDPAGMIVLAFLVPVIAGSLWTFGFVIMMNQRLTAENRAEKEKLQLIFDTSADGAMIARQSDGAIVDFNTAFMAMSGYTRAEIIGNTTIGMNVWHEPADRDRFVQELQKNGRCENMEFVFRRKDGSLLAGSLSAKIISIHGEAHTVSVVHDITQSKRAEEALRESEALYRSILNASPDDITITDIQGRIQVISPAAKKMFGYEPEYDRFIGTAVIDFILPEERERAKANILRTIKEENGGPNEYHGVRKDGSIFTIEVNSGIITDASRRPSKMIFVIRDVTERKQADQHIQQLVKQLEIEKKAALLNANTDSLTGLANRRYFDEALNSEFQRLKRSGAVMSLIMLDVDHFKKFNDTYGHLAGDDCLRWIGTTLKTIFQRATDVVARYGGEEFVVILAETDPAQAAPLAERIREAVQALAIPHTGSDISKVVTVSLGVVTVYPARLASAEEVVALADGAMYLAKKGGRNRTCANTEPGILETLWDPADEFASRPG